jgi:hypothetical protein
MSGQPNKTSTDPQRFRKEYLANLDVEIANNEKNLQANLLHKRTGIVASQLTDYRTTTEKLADITVLRVELRRQLRRIMDAENTERAVGELNAGEVQFAIQNIEKSITDLRPRFKYGVPAEMYVMYLTQLAQAQQRVGVAANAELAQLPNQKNLEDIHQHIELLERRLGGDAQQVANEVLKRVDRNQALLRNVAVLAAGQNEGRTLEERQAIDRIIKNAIDDLPTQRQLQDLIERLDRVVGDEDLTKEILLEMGQILNPNPDSAIELESAYDEIRRAEAQRRFEPPTPPRPSQRRATFAGSVEARLGHRLTDEERVIVEDIGRQGGSVAQALDFILQRTGEEKGAELEEGVPVSTKSPAVKEAEDVSALLKDVLKAKNRAERERKRQDITTGTQPASAEEVETFAKGRRLPEPIPRGSQELKQAGGNTLKEMKAIADPYVELLAQKGVAKPLEDTGSGQKQEKYKRWYRRNYDAIVEEYSSRMGSKASVETPRPLVAPQKTVGTGLKKKRIRGRGIHIEEGMGIKEELKFAPFGRYYINLVKLNDDIICLCKKNGTNISDCKTRRVSVALAKVLRKIVKGGNPSFDDLAALNDEDKTIYSQYMRKCQIVGEGLDIPKVDDKTDLNQFEIMKGEILSGNDSTELIKKFKILIMKLVHNSRLPKGQAKELLMDLAQLGY